MMSLDEAIKHCEEEAEAEEQKYKDWKGDYSHLKKIDSCLECAKEHRQLADWLRELKRWREFGRKNAQFINDWIIQNRIDELFSSEIKDDADVLRIANETLTLRTTNEFCKSYNKRFEREGSDSE